MNISQNGVDLIKNFEGFVPIKYLDVVGIPTIGYGHKLLKGESFPKGVDYNSAEQLLKNDLMPIESTINSLVKIILTQNQYDALCSFVYNLGCGAFRHSHLLTYLNSNQVAMAASQFTLWNHAGGQVVPGLTKRRLAEQQLFLT